MLSDNGNLRLTEKSTFMPELAVCPKGGHMASLLLQPREYDQANKETLAQVLQRVNAHGHG
jgi:hypothetical protein